MRISPNDKNQYQHLTLPNGLRILLVHVPESQKAAAALAVNVGHFDDPTDREGLAHYLEHMLFLGTESYPKIGEFQSFIASHGGSNNAWTGTEHTCFFFDIAENHLERGLKRFSKFFINPLFNIEALNKEREAVDSEYKMKYKDESRRLYQVLKETINPKHPFAKFSVGNLQTLSDRDGKSIREEIISFYESHYSADIMTLTIAGPQSLQNLENLANQYFSDIKTLSIGSKKVDIPFVTENEQGIQISIEPEKAFRKLTMAFCFDNVDHQYKSKPLSYIAHLVGYEGHGSLMQYLKDKQWVNSLSAGGGASGSNYKEFTISCTLTRKGLEHTDEIVSAIFYAINQIKLNGVQEWRFREKQAVMESAFQFQESTRILDLASYLVLNFFYYPISDLIYGDYRMSDYEPKQIIDTLNHLTPSNLRLTIVAQGCTNTLNESELKEAKWYDTPYIARPLSPQQLALWSEPIAIPEIVLPSENPYICYDLTPNELENAQTYPSLIEDLDGFRLWHMQEPEFRVPKGTVYVAIDSPNSVSSPEQIVKMRICVEMFLESLARETYQAEIAGMGYNMYAHQGGLTLTLTGFTQKQPQLLLMILDKFATREFNPIRFKEITKQLKRNWQNSAKDRPLSQLFNAMSGILQPNNPPYSVLLEALDTITIDDLDQFVEALLAELHVELFVYGDWTQSQAINLGQALKSALRVKNQIYGESLRPLVMLGESGTFQRKLECAQADSAVVVYHQSQLATPEAIGTYTLANHLMSSAFFQDIRTKQQLGYMVGTGNMPLNKHPGIVLYVQSPKAGSQHLLTAIDEFLNAFYMVLLELTEYQWHSSKRGLLNQIMAPDTNLKSRAQRYWVAIGNKDYQFDHRERVIDAIKQLSRADMIRFVVEELKPRTANRLVMHTQGLAHQNEPFITDGLEIGSIEEFQLRPKDVEMVEG